MDGVYPLRADEPTARTILITSPDREVYWVSVVTMRYRAAGSSDLPCVQLQCQALEFANQACVAACAESHQQGGLHLSLHANLEYGGGGQVKECHVP